MLTSSRQTLLSTSGITPQEMADNIELSSVVNKDYSGSENELRSVHTLHEAARHGSEEDIEYLLANYEDTGKKRYIKAVDQLDEYLLSPLHYAVRYNNVACVQKLIQKSAIVDVPGEDGATPLHFAAKFYKPKRSGSQTIQVVGNDEEDEEDQVDCIAAEDIEISTLQILLEHSADINLADNYGLTPLHYASLRGNTHAAEFLLSIKGCRHEIKDKQLMTPLHMAANYGRLKVTQMLLDKSVDVLCKDDEENTPLHGASMEGHLDVVKAIVEHVAGGKGGGYTLEQVLNAFDLDKCTPLHYAVENSHLDVVAYLLKKGASVTAKKINGNTPLHLAAVRNNLEMVKLLIYHGAKVNVQNEKQQSPLHRAAGFNQVEIVTYLLSRGSKIELRDRDFLTPLLVAAAYGRTEAMKCLLDKGASITATDFRERSAAYWAAQEDQPETLQLLLSRNAKTAKLLVEYSDSHENTPLHVACKDGYVDCVKILLEHGALVHGRNEEELTPLHLAADNGRTQVVRVLLSYNQSIVNDEDESSNTPLHIAATKGHVHVVSALLEYGAAVDARNAISWTPLDCAAANGWPKTIAILIDGDAPIDPTDKRKITPLHLAARSGYKDCVNLLLRHGADISNTDVTGRNCLDMAIQEGHRDVAASIIKNENWELAMKNTSLSPSGQADTPMRKLIRKLPDIAEMVFDKCTVPNDEPTESKNYRIAMRYEFLDDVYSDWFEETNVNPADAKDEYEYEYVVEGNTKKYMKRQSTSSFKDNHPLMVMVKSKREQLLAHPLVNCFLRYKWQRFGRYIYYVNLLIYAVYLFFLTGFTVYNPYAVNKTCHLKFNGTLPTSFTTVFFVSIGGFVVTMFAAVRLAIEIFQLIYQRVDYLVLENLLEVTGFVMSILYTVDARTLRFDWRLQFGAVSIFLAWFNLILFIRKFPILGIYVVMFIDIFRTFVKFFVIFVLFIVAFGLAFFVLLQNQVPFSTPGRAIIKTAVMTIGEFEFDSIFNEPNLHVCFQAVTYILFVIFIIFMPILLMNLLVGLAVDDIKEVQEQAALKRLAMQVHLVLDIEQFMPNWLRTRWSLKEQVFYPNVDNSIVRIFSWMRSVSPLSKVNFNPEKSPIEKLASQQKSLKSEVKELRDQIKSMQTQNERLLTLVGALVQHHNVAVDDEDDITARLDVN